LAYLRGEKNIDMPKKRRQPKGKIMIRGGNIFNIKDMNVDVPLGVFNVITGVSGSGKSSLMYEILHRNLEGAAGEKQTQLFDIQRRFFFRL
jgi:excinuclease ABC subunit A